MLSEYSWGTLGVIWLGALIGAIASGGAGFAFVLAAASIWLHVLDPVRTAILSLASSTLMQLGTIWPLLPHVKAERVGPFIVTGLVGIPLGVWLLTRTDASVMKIGLGAFLTTFGLYALLAPRLPVITGGGRVADAVVGFLGGILGGIGGYSGVLPTIWTQLRGWPKIEARAVYQPYILVIQIATIAVVGIIALDRTTVMLQLAILPPLAVGGWLGWRFFSMLDERMFRKVIAALLVISGVTLVL
ncbi:sulfite exporter TauE/SafE [Variibacter gotjawalensis]|uniref:Probable membrane transporter protein n=1 Tax=Variibacter gotjawalensis TaxID=1333996 RepID=A0A0S3PP39_9BRAD|nr:sulfite exporter TauE/SafE family protein [Variibacter gotjawalensis]NIK47925.1 hypothetical protein [Variibacter gotjawalensis]RZS49803.1 hypothetical protein EV661_2248 [Variibacter gotjawalensis]BAT57632.1 sulfite exporter TauE/SafE [Variibacter gotjawalensis]